MVRMQFRELWSGIIDQQQHTRVTPSPILRQHRFRALREPGGIRQRSDLGLARGLRRRAKRRGPERIALRRIHQIVLRQIFTNRRQRRFGRSRRNDGRQLLQILRGYIPRLVHSDYNISDQGQQPFVIYRCESSNGGRLHRGTQQRSVTLVRAAGIAIPAGPDRGALLPGAELALAELTLARLLREGGGLSIRVAAVAVPASEGIGQDLLLCGPVSLGWSALLGGDGRGAQESHKDHTTELEA